MDKIFEDLKKEIEEIRVLNNANMKNICDLSIRINRLDNFSNVLLEKCKKFKQ